MQKSRHEREKCRISGQRGHYHRDCPERNKAKDQKQEHRSRSGLKATQMTFAANSVRRAIGLHSVGRGAGQRSNPAAGAFHKVNILAGTQGPIPRGGLGTEMTV